MLKNENGFTLVEMLVVMLVITVLLLLIIPNVSTQSESVNDKGCEALISIVQTQADAYFFEEGSYPKDIDELFNKNYLNENQMACSDNSTFSIDANGKVSKDGSE